MNKQEQDKIWEERYFQTILAITSGVCANPKKSSVNDVALKPIFVKAKKIIDKLKEDVEASQSSDDADVVK